MYRHTIIASSLLGTAIVGTSFIPETTLISVESLPQEIVAPLETEVRSSFAVATDTTMVEKAEGELSQAAAHEPVSPDHEQGDGIEEPASKKNIQISGVPTVPFYSQFTDISAPEWRKVGCGIASLAMVIEYYEPNQVSVDELLKEGIAARAFLSDAGWIHSGLIGLSHKYGLSGESHSLAGSSMEDAFAVLQQELEEGPVMASVHYQFDPQSVIPHLVVVNGVRDGKVFYNDPSESRGGGSISIAKFQSAWKKRYIDIRPT